MAARWWGETENKFSHIELDEYVVMPNHIHGIVLIVGADLRVRPQREDRKSNGHKQLEHQRQKKINRADTQVRPYRKSFNGSRP